MCYNPTKMRFGRVEAAGQSANYGSNAPSRKYALEPCQPSRKYRPPLGFTPEGAVFVLYCAGRKAVVGRNPCDSSGSPQTIQRGPAGERRLHAVMILGRNFAKELTNV